MVGKKIGSFVGGAGEERSPHDSTESGRRTVAESAVLEMISILTTIMLREKHVAYFVALTIAVWAFSMTRLWNYKPRLTIYVGVVDEPRSRHI